jgi:glycine/D-amino acid oxidase-like deaminating enzyme
VHAEAEVLVIGGGVIGCAVAYHLASAGSDVLLVDRQELNREASGSNAGNIHLQLIGRGKQLRRGDPTSELGSVARLHVLAHELWTGLEAELQQDLGVRFSGGLMIADSRDGVESLRIKSSLERANGIDIELISGSQARAREPGLSARVLAATWCPGEGYANPLLVGPAYAQLAACHGARIRTWTDVRAIEQDRSGFAVTTSSGIIRAGKVVNAGGAWSAAIAAMIGVQLPVTGLVLSMNVTEPHGRLLSAVVQHVRQLLTLKQTQYGTFLIGGGWPARTSPDGMASMPDMAIVRQNLRVACAVLPALRGIRLIRSWAATSPQTGNLTCLLGPMPSVRNFYLAIADHSGFTLAPLIGRVLGRLIVDGDPSADVGDFMVGGRGVA